MGQDGVGAQRRTSHGAVAHGEPLERRQQPRHRPGPRELVPVASKRGRDEQRPVVEARLVRRRVHRAPAPRAVVARRHGPRPRPRPQQSVVGARVGEHADVAAEGRAADLCDEHVDVGASSRERRESTRAAPDWGHQNTHSRRGLRKPPSTPPSVIGYASTTNRLKPCWW